MVQTSLGITTCARSSQSVAAQGRLILALTAWCQVSAHFQKCTGNYKVQFSKYDGIQVPNQDASQYLIPETRDQQFSLSILGSSSLTQCNLRDDPTLLCSLCVLKDCNSSPLLEAASHHHDRERKPCFYMICSEQAYAHAASSVWTPAFFQNLKKLVVEVFHFLLH